MGGVSFSLYAHSQILTNLVEFNKNTEKEINWVMIAILDSKIFFFNFCFVKSEEGSLFFILEQIKIAKRKETKRKIRE